MDNDWLQQPCAVLHEAARSAALARQEQLTKPPGALGRLEDIAVQLAAWQGVAQPTLQRIHISIFAADHGVAEEGVSLFPQAVTAEMVRNFARGGAAISVLARQLNADLEVINLGTVTAVEPLPGVRDERIAAGTANLARTPAMTQAQCTEALQAGRNAAVRAKHADAQLFVGGEMGIANTTSASALACALLGESPHNLAGRGTGLDAAGVSHKADVIAAALVLHGVEGVRIEAQEILRRLGGFEIAGLAGAYIAAAQLGLPILVDGFISSVAALVAVRINPSARAWMLFAHTSAEAGHQRVLSALDAQPLLQLGMRLGEGSGAAVAVPLLQLACTLHSGMATFAEAGVSEQH
ncbi:Nicotinate-nucleotide--dimethylbenzimidazole phosphoribosyltransferase [Ferriphaselus amnicola]|uniref:Nicotinate-nucleotide--dimethylbenzimidazole phosphoribosyltransferase n=1 Tax=Ferriphaselus amnicola TaxID=1188319 RepID=A0A2Z6GCG1_9PROT|nr:nicotinate-nucleotide--dimethylbenzimidazole phosphoribosyltransferase [Ferriphaselus amnicola]BBE50845.1 Nicotinate-nucleotide--dimethylbenzimidazole phosphoribosyltransferase [Ferriphaselus amnicola]